MKTVRASPSRKQGLRYCSSSLRGAGCSYRSHSGRVEMPLRGAKRSGSPGRGWNRRSPAPLGSAFQLPASITRGLLVHLGSMQLGRGSCSPLRRWQRKITRRESMRLKGSRKPGFCTCGGWTEKLLFFASSGHPLPGRSSPRRVPAHP